MARRVKEFSLILSVGFGLALGASCLGLAEDKEISTGEKTPPAESLAPLEKEKGVSEPSASSVSNLLSLSARFDSSYSAGGPVSQGFAIPSVRLSVFGSALKHVNYRLSLGQTREFSTAALPQILPVEAYLNACSDASGEEKKSVIRFRAGMFTPLMNPNWTPDLSEVDLPDYHETHRALFLSRDIGAELLFRPWGEHAELGVGFFNGTGVFSLNTNNGKAVNGYARINYPVGDLTLEAGAGTYYFSQSSQGSVNYKSSSATDVFAGIESRLLRTKISVDGFISHFEDSTRTVDPTGGAGSLHITIVNWLKLFARIESANRSPLLTGPIKHYQFGPEILFSENLKAFVTFQQLETGGSVEKIMLMRIRLSI